MDKKQSGREALSALSDSYPDFMIKYIIALSAFLFLSPVLAQACADHESNQGKKEACHGDVQKFCKDVKPGDGNIHKCLADHKDSLSTECKEGMKEAKEHHDAKQEACKGDVEKLCKDVQKGEGRIRDCLKSHESSLSADCKATFDKKP